MGTLRASCNPGGGQDREFADLDRQWSQLIREAQGDWVQLESDCRFITKLYQETIEECIELRSKAMSGEICILPIRPWSILASDVDL